jgi:uncharacterized protein (TIGR02145 family)
MKTCTKCNTILKPHWDICRECGTPIKPEVRSFKSYFSFGSALKAAIGIIAGGLILYAIIYFLGTGSTGRVTDIDRNTYRTMKIGDQWWMVENLKVSRYRDGSAIANVTQSSQWTNLSTGAMVFYDHSESLGKTYGKLYNWYAVSDPRGLCPEGWHIPTENEWDVLVDYLGGSSVAGGKLKATRRWRKPNTGATNESGFNALPGGYRGSDGSFRLIGSTGTWWSSTEGTTGIATSRGLTYYSGEVFSGRGSKQSGFSVRCMRSD